MTPHRLGRRDVAICERAAFCFTMAVSAIIIAFGLAWCGRMAWEYSAERRADDVMRKQSHAHDYNIYELRQ